MASYLRGGILRFRPAGELAEDLDAPQDDSKNLHSKNNGNGVVAGWVFEIPPIANARWMGHPAYGVWLKKSRSRRMQKARRCGGRLLTLLCR
jgi:hypothetical protein